MTKLLLILVLVLLPIHLCAQGMGAEMEKFVNQAIANTQQAGEFYFIPFPENKGFPYRIEGRYGWNNNASVPAQLTLMILDHFQKSKNMDILSFDVQRDPASGSTGRNATIHGIFVKAVPKKK